MTFKYSKVRLRDIAEEATLNNIKNFASWAWARKDIVRKRLTRRGQERTKWSAF